MARNKKLISVAPFTVIDGVNVINACDLEEALFGPEWWKGSSEERNSVIKAWMSRNGAHYYAEEKWVFDEDDRMYRGFDVRKGVREAKRYGFRTVVVENLS